MTDHALLQLNGFVDSARVFAQCTCKAVDSLKRVLMIQAQSVLP